MLNVVWSQRGKYCVQKKLTALKKYAATRSEFSMVVTLRSIVLKTI